jgi:hypothetical protein
MNQQPVFNYVQTVFTLNMFANLVSDKKAPDAQLQQELSTMLDTLFGNADVQNLIGEWQVVWGPVVGSYGSDAKKPDKAIVSNALYVAYNAADNQYVVATSATNPISKYGWFVEDFDVRTMVPWADMLTPIEVPANAPRISNGSYLGLSHLLSLQSAPVSNVGIGMQTIMEWLKSTFSTSTKQTQLVVTGHSLGGAMSSVLGLYIAETSPGWNPTNSVIVSSMPTAGATPGNKAFSDHHSKVMGMRTIRFWNRLDPVPHGWQPDLVELVPFLYYPFLKPGALFQGLVALVVEQSLQGTKPYPEGGFYTQLMPQVQPLPGQINIVSAANPSAASVLQFLVDIGLEELFIIIKVPKMLAALIVDGVNLLLKEFASEETIDQFMDKLRAKLALLPASKEWIDKLFLVLESIIAEVENVFLFLIQLVFQHVTSYAYLIGTSAMHPLSQSIINSMVSNKKLDPDYTNIIDKQNNPQLVVQQMTPVIGSALLSLLTPAFLAKKGWDIL